MTRSATSTAPGDEPTGEVAPGGLRRFVDAWWPLVPIGLLCYVPLLLTRPGWISADTKTYLYLDPSRLLGRAWSIWDPNVGLGTVSHQTIGYLWPMGPWFWLFEAIGAPDWMAQRLWWGTLLVATVAGGAYLLRRFDLPPVAVWPGAIVLGLSPYSVAYLGRLSGVLLPAVGLPWLLAFTIQAVRTGRWRYPALFALTVTTVGSVNLTALALVGIAPLLWLVWVVVTREAAIGEVLRATARIGLLTLGTSAWWLAGLSVQASHGIDIVRYTESAEVVARTAIALEVLRGLGYWFFYGGDKLQLWIEPSFQYTKRRLVYLGTFFLPAVAFASGLVGRWRRRLFFVALLVIGVVVSVGANPWNDPPLVGRLVKGFLATDRGLAFRSLPRAVPLVALASAALIAGLIAALSTRDRRLARGLAVVVVLAAIFGMVPLWQRDLVQDSLARRDVPAYWTEAARLLDERDDGTRVLEVPGSDFASYRWGNTVDPITPGMMDRPYVARELVPWGSPLAADLVNDLDLLFQERTLSPEAIAPVARLMRAGDLVFRGDLQYDRYALARPKQVWELLGEAPGLGEPIALTGPYENRPGGPMQMWDEYWTLYERHLPDGPAVAIVPVEDARPIVDVKPAAGALLLAGDGAGIVDAATAGRIDGHELIRYSANLTADDVAAELDRGAALVVTDTNRKRGERWGSLRHNRGETERVDQQALATDISDNRLPRFPDRGTDVQTVTVVEGGATVDATSYGNPITYAADDRGALALDGDLDTAWATAAFSDARGERLVITPDEPIDLDHLVLNQLTEERSRRRITRVRIDLGDGRPVEVDLGPESRTARGQRIELGERRTDRITLTILADDLGNPERYGNAGPVGFAEVTLGDNDVTAREIVRVPTDLVDAAAGRDAARTARTTYLFTRVRQDPTDRTRDDEERGMARRFRVPADRDFTLRGTARLSARADDPILDRELGTVSDGIESIESSHRMAGTRVERASAAFDGDPTTGWLGAWALTRGEHLTVTAEEPREFASFDLTVIADGLQSVPRVLDISVDGERVARVELPEIADGDEPGHTVTVPVDFPATTGRSLRLDVVSVRPARSLDWTANEFLDHPLAITDIDLDGVRVPEPAARLDDRCRTDLVTLDGEPVPVRILGSTADALAGEPLTVEPCGDAALDLAAGEHDLVVRPGAVSGFDLDQLVLDTDPDAGPTPAAAGTEGTDTGSTPTVTVDDEALDAATVTLTGLTPGEPVWLVFGQSRSDGWRARVRDGGDLGASETVDGYANGWLLTPTSATVTVDLDFTPQHRVNIAFIVSGVAVLACLALAIRRPRGAPAGGVAGDLTTDWSGEPERGPLPARLTTVLAVVAAVVGAAVAGPVVGVLVGAAAVVGARGLRSRRLLAAAPVALLAAAVATSLWLQWRDDVPAGIDWAADLQPVHPLALAAVLTLGLDAVVHACRARTPDPTADPPEPEEPPQPDPDG